jgi:hypothetical protein
MASSRMANPELLIAPQSFNQGASSTNRSRSTVRDRVEVLLIAQAFERIDDHITNVAQEIIMLAGGRSVRHSRNNLRLTSAAAPPFFSFSPLDSLGVAALPS